MKSFSSPIVREMHGNIKSILRHKPKNILHIGTKNAPTLPPNEILHEILELEIKIEEINKGCKFIILMQTYCFENWKAGNNCELTNMLISLNVPMINNKNISWKHLGCKGLH